MTRRRLMLLSFAVERVTFKCEKALLCKTYPCIRVCNGVHEQGGGDGGGGGGGGGVCVCP